MELVVQKISQNKNQTEVIEQNKCGFQENSEP